MVEISLAQEDAMKNVLLIGTGGTIASEMTAEGLTPMLSSQQLLQFVPSISDICNVTCMELFSLDSTNITPAHWVRLAQTIRENYAKYDGFVICHGTDTMAYTAAALSYLIQDSPKPIILTGAQKPITFDSTDSKTNLLDSFLCAASQMCGVMVVFNGKVIAGTRAKKTRSKSFKAFSSINYPELATIQSGYLMEYIRNPHAAQPTFYDKMNPRVALLKMIPGTQTELFSFLLERNDALIVESFGVGGLPSYKGLGIEDILLKAIDQGKTVVLTTQVQNEGSDLSVYNVGYQLRKLRLLEAYDMTTEAVVAKLMWILGQTSDPERVQALFYTPVANDLLYRKEQ